MNDAPLAVLAAAHQALGDVLMEGRHYPLGVNRPDGTPLWTWDAAALDDFRGIDTSSIKTGPASGASEEMADLALALQEARRLALAPGEDAETRTAVDDCLNHLFHIINRLAPLLAETPPPADAEDAEAE